MKIFYDTNAVLKLQDKIFNEPFYLSSITFQELEHIKTDNRKTDEVKYKAKKISKLLDRYHDKYDVIFYDDMAFDVIKKYGISCGQEPDADTKICACAKILSDQSSGDMLFCSDDICCKNIARQIFGINVQGTINKEEEIYTGYKEIIGDSNTINSIMSDPNFVNSFCENEYLVINNTETNEDQEMRFSNGSFVGLRLPPSKFVKGKNSLQRCALDMLNNKDISICAVLGYYGSGKSFLGLRMSLYHVTEKGNQSSILGVRSPVGEGKEVGFLPGDLSDKVDKFFLPLAQQLDGGEFELESLRQSGTIDSTIPFYMKGTTYDETIIVCDEAEDLTEKELRLVGTRIGKNSRIFLCGDYKQSVINVTEDNALVRMCEEFKGDPSFACIYLKEDVRSSASKMFADLFNN